MPLCVESVALKSQESLKKRIVYALCVEFLVALESPESLKLRIVYYVCGVSCIKKPRVT